MKLSCLLLAVALAVVGIAPAAAFELPLNNARIKDNGDIRLSDDLRLGRYQSGKYIATPDNLQIQGDGITCAPGAACDASPLRVAPPSGFARTLSSRFTDTFNAADFGLKGDGASHPLSERYATLASAQTDYPHAVSLSDEIDWAAIQKAVNFAQSTTFPGESMVGEVVLPSGFNVRTNRSIDFNKPVRARFGSMLNYTGTSGDCIIVGSAQPAQHGEQNTGYDLDFAGCRSLSGNTAGPPTGVVEGGSVGLRLVSIQMSRVRIRQVLGFTWAGCFFDTREILWLAPTRVVNGQTISTKRANVQQNAIDCGLAGYNGAGILAASKSGQASVGANEISWRDLSTNWINLQADGVIQSVEYLGTTSNTWRGPIEVPAPGATIAAAVYGPYNNLHLPFIEGTLYLGPKTYATTVLIDNNVASLANVVDDNPFETNDVTLGPPASDANNANGYPTALTIQPAVTACNTWGRKVSLNLYAQLVPSAGTPAVVAVSTGRTAGTLTSLTRAQAPSGVGETHVPLSIPLRYGQCYRFDVSGTANLSPAKVIPLR